MNLNATLFIQFVVFFILALFSFLLPSEVHSQQKIPTSLEPSPQTRVTDRQQKAKSDLNSDSQEISPTEKHRIQHQQEAEKLDEIINLLKEINEA